MKEILMLFIACFLLVSCNQQPATVTESVPASTSSDTIVHQEAVNLILQD
jgi:uncharacterized lipoprotein YajG